MLKPGWPNSFRRTIISGKKPKTLYFDPNEPVSVTPAEMALLKRDIGVSIFEVERDEKNRPRFIESEIETGNETSTPPTQELAGNVAHV